MDKQTGGTALYPSAQVAMEYMSPGDQIVPIMDKEELTDYETGKKRLPAFNKHR